MIAVVAANLHQPRKYKLQIEGLVKMRESGRDREMIRQATVKKELSIKCGAEGSLKKTMRSSSTLEASSGMVSGKANSFGDETQEFCGKNK